MFVCLWETVYSFLPHVMFTPVFQESHQAEEKSRWRSQRGELRLSERVPTLGRRLLRSFVPSLSLTSWPAPCWSEARSRGCGVSNCVGDISIVPIAPIWPCWNIPTEIKLLCVEKTAFCFERINNLSSSSKEFCSTKSPICWKCVTFQH